MQDIFKSKNGSAACSDLPASTGKLENRRTNIIISNKGWHRKFIEEVATRTESKVVYIDQRDKVTYECLKQLNPKYVFFPHWSYRIPDEVFVNFECVIFHMTDLPFGRGGSPLQNLIERGIYETRLSAIRCGKELDGGDVYLKAPLSLWGTAEEIYLRAAELSKEMQKKLIENEMESQKELYCECFLKEDMEEVLLHYLILKPKKHKFLTLPISCCRSLLSKDFKILNYNEATEIN